MTRVLRVIGIAALITAMLHATAGICLCHRGPDAPLAMPGGHSCCHAAEATGRLAVGGVPACCHIETAQRDMTSVDAVQLAPPSAVVVLDAIEHTSDSVTHRFTRIPPLRLPHPSRFCASKNVPDARGLYGHLDIHALVDARTAFVGSGLSRTRRAVRSGGSQHPRRNRSHVAAYSVGSSFELDPVVALAPFDFAQGREASIHDE